MRPDDSHDNCSAARRPWKAPTFTHMSIRAETKSAQDASGPTEPQPPAAPASKLGFSFEMAFPLSARLE